MPSIRIRDASELLGVSDDTVRRWIGAGHLSTTSDEAGRQVIAGDELAAHVRANAGRVPRDLMSADAVRELGLKPGPSPSSRPPP